MENDFFIPLESVFCPALNDYYVSVVIFLLYKCAFCCLNTDNEFQWWSIKGQWLC